MIPFAVWTPGVWELLIILLIVFVLFGAGRLPQVFRTLGEGIKSFREGQKDDPVDVGTDRKQLDADRMTEAEELEDKVR